MQNDSCVAIIKSFFQKKGMWKRLKGEMAVYYWPQVVGKEIALRTSAKYLNGNLFITVVNSVFSHEIFLRKTEILEKYQKLLGKGILRDVIIKVDAVSLKPVEENSDFKLPELDESEKNEIVNHTKNIADEALAKKFQQIMETNLQRQKKLLQSGGKCCCSCGVIIEKNFELCPICEIKLTEELNEYYAFVKKNQHVPTEEELAIFKGLDNRLLQELKQQKEKGE